MGLTVLAAITDNPSRFGKSRQVTSYVGLKGDPDWPSTEDPKVIDVIDAPLRRLKVEPRSPAHANGDDGARLSR